MDWNTVHECKLFVYLVALVVIVYCLLYIVAIVKRLGFISRGGPQHGVFIVTIISNYRDTSDLNPALEKVDTIGINKTHLWSLTAANSLPLGHVIGVLTHQW